MTTWSNSVDQCDICLTEITDHFIDGRMKTGQWALLCRDCHAAHGVGLGTGKGQRYERQPNGSFTKTEG